VYVLEKGHVRFSGSFGELDQQSQLKQDALTL
jgi:ABC-type branched-subunit amino acid transport system ATPase component